MALDIATVSGVAVDRDDGPLPRAWTYRVPAGGADVYAAGLAFVEWLYEAIGIYRVEMVAAEAPILGNSGGKVFTSELLVCLAFQAGIAAKSRRVRFVRKASQSVRRHFVGHGRPENPKAAVMARCAQLGWQARNHNEADALALWAMCKAEFDPTFRLESATPLFGKKTAEVWTR